MEWMVAVLGLRPKSVIRRMNLVFASHLHHQHFRRESFTYKTTRTDKSQTQLSKR
jgi:hypothetical protein